MTRAHLQAIVAAHEPVADYMHQDGRAVDAEGHLGVAAEGAGQADSRNCSKSEPTRGLSAHCPRRQAPSDSLGAEDAQGRPGAQHREELHAEPVLPVGRPSHVQSHDKASLCRCSSCSAVPNRNTRDII